MKKLVEAVDYESFFSGLEKILDKYKDKVGEGNVDVITKINIPQILKSIKQDVKNYNWNFYIMRLYRSFVASQLMKFVDDQKDRRNLDKMIDFPNTTSREYIDAIQIFKHYKGIEYPPIQKYDPGKTPFHVVKQELQNLEDEYKESIADDDRLVEFVDGDKIIIELPNDFCWMALGRHYCSAEANAMGHCGNQGGARSGQILSLRKKRKIGDKTYFEPFATFIYDRDDKTLGEMKGRANEKPADRYHPYIIELLKQPWIEGFGAGGYLPENNFSLNDLTDQQKEAVIKANPNLALYPGASLKSLPDKVWDKLTNKSTKTSGKGFFFDREKKKQFILVDIDEVVESRILEYIEDMEYYSETDRQTAFDNINSLPKEYIAHMYDTVQEELSDVISKEDFVNHVSRYGLDQEFIEEYELEDRVEELLDGAYYGFVDAERFAYEKEYLESLKKSIRDTEIRIGIDNYNYYGLFADDAGEDGSFVEWIGPEVKVAYDSDVYLNEDDIDDLEVEGTIDEVGVYGSYPDKEDLLTAFETYFGSPEKVEENKEYSKMKIYNTKNGKFVIKNDKDQVYSWMEDKWFDKKDLKDGVGILHSNKDELKKFIKDPNMLTEVSPPSKEAEDWIKARKSKFKERYGDDWERVLYATAWKKFGNLKEHADPRSYVNPWKGRGFEIDFEDYVAPNSKETGKKFYIKYKHMTGEITEPETGAYLLNTDDKVYDSFDEAMEALINTTFKDKFVTEGKTVIDNLKELAGIKEDKKSLNESFDVYGFLNKLTENEIDNVPEYESDNYSVSRDKIGNYIVKNKSTGKGVYLQGEDADKFADEVIYSDMFSKLNPQRQDHILSQYDEVVECDSEIEEAKVHGQVTLPKHIPTEGNYKLGYSAVSGKYAVMDKTTKKAVDKERFFTKSDAIKHMKELAGMVNK